MTEYEELVSRLEGLRQKFAGGGKVKSVVKAAKDYSQGPKLEDGAMKALAEGDIETATEMFRRLQELLELSDEDFSQMLGRQFDRQPEGKFIPEEPTDMDVPVGGYKNNVTPLRKAEGGSVDDDKMSTLRALGESLYGAIPYLGRNKEKREYAGETMEHLKSGLMSQWYGMNPTSGELEYAGPGSGTSYPSDEILQIDPEQYFAQLEQYKKEQGETGAIPGIIDETAAIPLLGEMLGFDAPDWAHEAGERSEVTRQAVRDKLGLEDPTGIPQHIADAGGMMMGQAPIPASWLRGAKPAVEAGKGAISQAGRVLGATPKAGLEFLSPIIEPKVGNYIAGSLFGGGVGAALEPGDIPPEIADLVARAEAGDEEALAELKVLYAEYLEQQEGEQTRELATQSLFDNPAGF